MANIKVTAPIISDSAARDDIAHVVAGTTLSDCGEISDATARTIASWWQGPGSIGGDLAALASGATVDRSRLIEDINLTGRTASPMWPEELECLATWAMSK